MGEIFGGMVSYILSLLMTLMLLSTFDNGDQITSFHQALREGGRAGANYPAPSFDPATNGTALGADNQMVDEPYLAFQRAFLAGVPHGKIDSFQYWPVASDNPEEVKFTATVEVPRFFFNMLVLIGGPSFSPTIKQTFTVYYYREWDYNFAVDSGAINPSFNGPAQSQ